MSGLLDFLRGAKDWAARQPKFDVMHPNDPKSRNAILKMSEGR